MRACRHRYYANLLGVVATLLRLAAHHTHSTLTILPRSLVDRQTLGARCAIDEVHGLETQLGQSLTPHLDKSHIAAAEVAAARDKYHTSIVIHLLGWLLAPLKVCYAVLVGVETLLASLIGHRCNLMTLPVWHLAL